MSGRVEAVCVSGTDLLPLPDKRPNRSGIDKKPVTGRVAVQELGLDEQSSTMGCVPDPSFNDGHPDPNLTYAHDLVERVEKQREAYQSLVEQSFDAYMDLAYAPFSYYREGLEAARRAVR